jgi:hypothetical protein
MTHPVPLAVLIGLSLCAAACTMSPPPPPKRSGSKSGAKGEEGQEVRKLSDDELGELMDVCHAVVVARVEERTESEGAIEYRLRVQYVVLGGRGDGSTHPVAEGTELYVSDFWFKPGAGGKAIGALGELDPYLFFLAQGQKPGRWFHMEDASAFPMPAARPTRERAEAMRRQLEKVKERQPQPAKEPKSP